MTRHFRFFVSRHVSEVWWSGLSRVHNPYRY
uniref:Uncharacterized protein n=1 Tax=Arundo donax TaxID=35708 RepID=A0A0A9BXH7_ARUDO